MCICVFCRNDSRGPFILDPDLTKIQFEILINSISFFSIEVLSTWEKKEHTHTHTHTHTHEATICSPFVIPPTKRLSSLVTHKQGRSQSEPADQVSREKLWRSSNVMGFDVDAELHYGTPMKSEGTLFICLLHMRRTSAGNMHRFSYAFFFLGGKYLRHSTPSNTNRLSQTSLYFYLCEHSWRHNESPSL